MKAKMCREQKRVAVSEGFDMFREKVPLLSKIPGDRIDGILRAKKESRSTRRGKRVGTDFLEFRQTP